MRTVYLMRHGQSRWDEEGVTDIRRKLSPRGKRDARSIGKRLAGSEPPPDRIVTSPARRARGTARRVAETWGYDGPLGVDERLYPGSQDGCLTLLRQLDKTAKSVLLVGHNPLLEEMALFLGDRALALGTATVVRIDVRIDCWIDLRLPVEGSVCQVWEPQKGQA